MKYYEVNKVFVFLHHSLRALIIKGVADVGGKAPEARQSVV